MTCGWVNFQQFFILGKLFRFPVISRQLFWFTSEQWISRAGVQAWKRLARTGIDTRAFNVNCRESKLNERGKKYYDTGNNLMFAAFDPSLMTETSNYVSAQAYREAGNDRNKSALTAAWAREPSSATFDPIKSPGLHGKLFGSAQAMYPKSQAIRQVSHIWKGGKKNKRKS